MNGFWTDYTLRQVVLGSAVIGITAGALGSFAVLRRQSLLGDTISHAALPGIALAFLLTGSKAPFVLLLGAALAGWVGTAFILSITRRTRLKEDSAQGIVLSVFFGIGLMLLTTIQRMPTAAKAGLDKFMFGQAATLMTADVVLMASLGGLSLLILAIYWKEFTLLAFNAEFGAALGLPMRRLEVLLTALIVVAIVIGLQTVGVVLMSAMLVAPAASARQWTDRLGPMVLLSAGLGALSGVSGAVVSSAITQLPTGPTIVIGLTTVALISVFFGARRGVVWAALRRRQNRNVFAADHILSRVYELSLEHPHMFHPHPLTTLAALMPPETQSGLPLGLSVLAERGLLTRTAGGGWALTAAGCERARQLGVAP